MKPSFARRRRPIDDTPPPAPLNPVCPLEDCGHLITEHNQFGCCYTDTPCSCLVPHGVLEDKEKEERDEEQRTVPRM